MSLYNISKKSNIDLCERQITFLKDIVKYIEDPELLPVKQEEVRIACLKKWNVPSKEPESKQNISHNAVAFQYTSTNNSIPLGSSSKQITQPKFNPTTSYYEYEPVPTKEQQEETMRNKHKNNSTYTSDNWKHGVNTKKSIKPNEFSSFEDNTTSTQNASLDKFNVDSYMSSNQRKRKSPTRDSNGDSAPVGSMPKRIKTDINANSNVSFAYENTPTDVKHSGKQSNIISILNDEEPGTSIEEQKLELKGTELQNAAKKYIKK